jgi:hypothetical protein
VGFYHMVNAGLGRNSRRVIEHAGMAPLGTCRTADPRT